MAQDLIKLTEGTTADLKALLKRKEVGLSTDQGLKPYVGLGNNDAIGLVTDAEFTKHLDESGKAELYYRNELNQTVPDTTGVDCIFTTKGNMGTGPSENTTLNEDGFIEVLVEGLYLYTAKAIYLGNPNGTRSLTLTYNGAGFAANVIRASDDGVVDVSITQLIQLNVGDIIGMAFYQNSGGSLDVYGGTSQTFLQLYRLGGKD